MAVECREKTTLDVREAALTMAIAVLVERIKGLSKADRDDLFELSKALFAAETDEDERAAAAGFHEILEQSTASVRKMVIEEVKCSPEKWIDFVGERIRTARENAGLTQQDLDHRTGLPQSHISRLEAGIHSPSRVTLEKIAKALEKPLSYFDPSATE